MVLTSSDDEMRSRLSRPVEAPDYLGFMGQFFKSTRLKQAPQPSGYPRPLSYSTFSRKAGFRSRSYIRDILVGQKRVVPANFERICHGLGLPSSLKEYFRLLVALEEPSILPTPVATGLRQRLEDVRGQLLRSLVVGRRVSKDRSWAKVLAADTSMVFAASGSAERGATALEIAARSRLSGARVAEALARLEQQGAIRQAGDRYLPIAGHLSMDALASEVSFQQDFERSLSICRARLPGQINRRDALFFASTVSVKERDLPRMREQLRKAMLDIIEANEDPEGDCIAEIVLGSTSNCGDPVSPRSGAAAG